MVSIFFVSALGLMGHLVGFAQVPIGLSPETTPEAILEAPPEAASDTASTIVPTLMKPPSPPPIAFDRFFSEVAPLQTPFGETNPFGEVNLAQISPSNTYEQLFVPHHRRQSGRTPFVPKDLPVVSGRESTSPNYAGSPSTSIGIPSGYGANWRSLGVGLGIQSRARFTKRADGGIGVGFGLGNANTIGLQVGISFVDVSAPWADGSISLKLHRQLPQDVSIALGATGVLSWGSPDGGSSIYGVASKSFLLRENVKQPFSQLTTTLGIGSGQFRSESQITTDIDAVGVFGAASLRILEPMSAIVEWTGQDLNLGISVVPFRRIPLVITPAISDVTGRAGDGPRFIVGIGYGVQF